MGGPDPMDPGVLLQHALQGDRAALRSFVDFATPILHARIARTLLRRRPLGAPRDVRQEIEDFTQQTFVALFAHDAKALRAWDPDRGMPLAGFLALLAEHEVHSTLRTQKRNPWSLDALEDTSLSESEAPTTDPEQAIASREVLSQVWTLLQDRLNDRGLAMFRWLYVEGRAIEEVCSITELKPDAVYAWRSRLGKVVRSVAQQVMSDPNGSSRSSSQRLP